ncbi:hypothetical protein A2U01_0085126, partial [Trifolium medium]|nr:hypothetical protein [Trifolium medium]
AAPRAEYPAPRAGGSNPAINIFSIAPSAAPSAPAPGAGDRPRT